MQNPPASVRVSGPPNSSFLVGYPGISATLVGSSSSLLLNSLVYFLEYSFASSWDNKQMPVLSRAIRRCPLANLSSLPFAL